MSKRKNDDLLESTTESGTKKNRKLDPVDEANAMTRKDFFSQTNAAFQYKPQNDTVYSLNLVYADNLPEKQLNDCFSLIERTSRDDYEPSSFGWHPRRKLREMKEKEMRYVMLTKCNITSEAASTRENEFAGFMSFMFTYDSTPPLPVLYIYEIHLVEGARGCGLGKHLMHSAEKIARDFGMKKVMLTCFKSNKNAYSFYERLGYRIDACSPKDFELRKKVSKSEYVIMSLDLRDVPQQSGRSEDTKQDEDAQVTEDDMECSTRPADTLKSSDKIKESLEKCLNELRDEYDQSLKFDTAEDIAGDAFDAINHGDTESALLHASRLRDLIELFQTRTIAQAKFQAALWTRTQRLRELLNSVVHKAECEGAVLPEELIRPADMTASGLNPIEKNLMNQGIAGTTTKIGPSRAEVELSRQQRKVKELERMVVLQQRQADQTRTAFRAREQALLKRESAAKIAEAQVAIRTEQINAREARIVQKMVTLAKAYDRDASLDADSEAHSDQGSEDEEDDEEASLEDDEDDSLEEPQEQSATNTEYSNQSRPEREIAESDSEYDKPKKLTISSSLELPTPEIMKWQRPRKDQVSTWLRRSGSARETFPSGKRTSDM